MREAARASLAAARFATALRRSVVAVVLLGAALISHSRAERGRYDFEHFYLDAAYVWQHGALNPTLDAADPALNRQLPFYLPTVSVLLAPIAFAGRPAAAAIWAVAQTAALWYCLHVLWIWPAKGLVGGRDERDASGAFLVVVLLGLPAVYEASRFNQVSFFTLALLLGGFAALERAAKSFARAKGSSGEGPTSFSRAKGSFSRAAKAVAREKCSTGEGRALNGEKHERTECSRFPEGRTECSHYGWAGLLFSGATVLKLLPALFGVWLLLKRRYRAFAWFVGAGLLLLVVPPLLVFGPARTWEYHAQWWRYNVVENTPARWLGSEAMGESSEHFSDRRNQSLTAVCGRLFWPGHEHAVAWQPLRLSSGGAIAVAQALSAALGLLLVLVTRRRAAAAINIDDAVWRLRGEFALYAIAIQVLAPLARMYYMVWTLPALAVLAWYATSSSAGAALEGAGRARGRWGRIGLLVWMAGMAAWPVRTLREYGVHQLMLIGVAVCVWGATRKKKDE